MKGGRDQLLQARGGEVQAESGGGQKAEGQAAGGAGEHSGAAQPTGVEPINTCFFLFFLFRGVLSVVFFCPSALCLRREG